jgi:chromosomal replication initiation ATPase DnaA
MIKTYIVVITGSTGCGKAYLACAVGHHACHYDYSCVIIEPHASSKQSRSVTATAIISSSSIK